MLRPSDFERFWSYVDQSERASECWLWTGSTTKTGYGQIALSGEVVKTHRAAWAIAMGCDPGEEHVLHSCDMPLCVRFSHLFLGSNDDNIVDKTAKGRAGKKLTAEQRAEIVALEGVMGCYRVGQKYGVDHSYVARLWRDARGGRLSSRRPRIDGRRERAVA